MRLMPFVLLLCCRRALDACCYSCSAPLWCIMPVSPLPPIRALARQVMLGLHGPGAVTNYKPGEHPLLVTAAVPLGQLS